MSNQKGFAALGILLVVAGLMIGLSLLTSAFTGGRTSSGIFGWQGIEGLEGIENFFTGIYNIFVVTASWITIFILLMVFLGVQGAFLYFYYRIGTFFWQFKPAVERIVREISGF